MADPYGPPIDWSEFKRRNDQMSKDIVLAGLGAGVALARFGVAWWSSFPRSPQFRGAQANLRRAAERFAAHQRRTRRLAHNR